MDSSVGRQKRTGIRASMSEDSQIERGMPGVILNSAGQTASPALAAVVVIGRPPALILWSSTFLFLGFLAVLLISVWVAKSGQTFTWASLQPSLRDQMFNYHPFFMILGLLYIHGIANLTYRLFPTANYLLMRIIHGSLQLTAVIFVGLAIYAVYYSKSQSSREKDRHFQSTHSWMGLIVISVIILQFLFGFLGLLAPGLNGRSRKKYQQVHRYSGIFIFLLACATALLGLDQLDGKTSLINVLCLIVVLYAINGVYILTKNEYGRMQSSDIVYATADERIPILATSG